MDSSSSSSGRRPYFIEEDDGLVSLVDMEAGFSGNQYYPKSFYSRPKQLFHGSVSQRRSYYNMGLRNSSVSYSSRFSSANRFYDARFEDYHHQHFLDACFLCNKLLQDNKDIFMYRGDTPFCSEECRQRQIEIDEAKEKKMNLSSSIKAMRKKDKRKSTTSPTKSTAHDCRFRTSTVAAA